MELTTNRVAERKAPCLVVTDVDNRQTHYELSEGNSVLAGSGESCAIRLSSGEANKVHCMFQLANGKLWAQDWNTEGKTLLNGKPLGDAASMSNQDELRIGTYRISACFTDALQPMVERCQQETSSLKQPDASSAEVSDGSSLFPEDCVFKDETRRSDAEDASAFDTQADWNQRNPFESNLLPDTSTGHSALNLLEDQPGVAISAVVAELEILRNEVVQLQMELTERDAQLLQLSEINPFGNEHRLNSADDARTEKLVARLEQLLAELDGADERVAVLENLLQVSEEANQAEQEERRQLESWVNQIERRVLAREAEMAAEAEKLQKCVQEERSQRNELKAQLKNALQLSGQENVADRAARNMIADLRSQNADLENRLSESQRRLAKQTQNSVQDIAATDTKESLEMKQRIQVLEMELARERAEIARKREHFTRFQQEMEQRLDEVKQTAENNCRITAMKQHLRELHHEEKLERQERFERSLSGRIAMLWQKLDGR